MLPMTGHRQPPRVKFRCHGGYRVIGSCLNALMFKTNYDSRTLYKNCSLNVEKMDVQKIRGHPMRALTIQECPVSHSQPIGSVQVATFHGVAEPVEWLYRRWQWSHQCYILSYRFSFSTSIIFKIHTFKYLKTFESSLFSLLTANPKYKRFIEV